MFKRLATVLFVICSLLAPGGALLAQGPEEKVDLEMIVKIKDEGLKRSQVMEILSYLTDVYGPRLTGSPNIKSASEWAKQKLTEWGLQNAHLEAWGPFGRGWNLESFTASVTAPQFIPLIAYPKAWSPSTNGAVRGEVVYFDAKTEAELDAYRGKLKGAIVLLAPARQVKAHFEPEARRQSDERLLVLANAEPTSPGSPARPTQGQGSTTPEQRAAQALQLKKLEMCYSEGAAVVLEPGRGDGGTIFVQSVSFPQPPNVPAERRVRPWAKDSTPAIPQAVVAVEQYNRIIRMLTRGVHVEMEVNIAARFQDQDPMSYNVIAEIPGSDLKNELVMLGAHFDSWHSGTGATDNAAGSAVCLEAVRILQALGIKPRRTIRLGLWSGEEQGLLGSRAYVADHFGKRIDPQPPSQGRPQDSETVEQNPRGRDSQSQRQQTPPRFELKPEHARVAGYFNLDNGTGKIRGVYLQGNDSVRTIFRAWLAPFKEMGASTLSINNTGGTDHLSFDAVGLPGFQFIQDPVEYETRTHHSNMDVYDRIQDEDMMQAAVIMASFVYHTAIREEKLPRKALPGPSQVVTGR